MKRFIISSVLVLSSFIAFSQSIKRDNAGNFFAQKALKVPDNKTTYTFTDSKGNVWPVYQSKSGKYYALRMSKNGNTYKQYLKIN